MLNRRSVENPIEILIVLPLSLLFAVLIANCGLYDRLESGAKWGKRTGMGVAPRYNRVIPRTLALSPFELESWSKWPRSKRTNLPSTCLVGSKRSTIRSVRLRTSQSSLIF
jgi:hypothetical protein